MPANSLPLEGRVALVTGGGTGIGAGITMTLADRGARVVIVQPDQRSADECAERLCSDGADVLGIGADLSGAGACAEAVATCVALRGRVDVLVNNAAITGPGATGDLLQFPDAQLDAIIDVNVKAAFRCSRDAARNMTRAGGAIVNVASVGAFAAQHRSSAYVASKAALVGMTRGMAFELAPYGIRVTAVAPGDIKTVSGDEVPPAGQWWDRRAPLGRRGTPLDVARAVAFLASDEAGYITGQTLTVDGGWLSY